MSNKYSVIIPVYKAQGTLKRCVDSLLTQNYTDAEIILVNDGSPDDCGKICEEYAANFPQVKYIAKENGGVSSARNAGIDAASGTYVTFVDSDDYVANGYFAEIDKALAEYDWDYILFSNSITDGQSVTQRHYAPYTAKNRTDTMLRIADENRHSTINVPWAKVYKRSIIIEGTLRFNEKLSIAEDWSFNMQYAINTESICRVDFPLYYVSTENGDSLSRRIIPDYYEQHNAAVNDVRRAIDNSGLSESEKTPILAEINFGDYKCIYTKAKFQHRQKMRLADRIKCIRDMCRSINSRKYIIPQTRYCRLISLPVKLNLALVIDAMAWVLVHR